MTPLNYGAFIFEAFLGLIGVFGQDPVIRYVSFAACLLWAVFYCYVYHYFMKKDPDRLQSESFNLENKALALGKISDISVENCERDVSGLTRSLTGSLLNPGTEEPD